MRKPLEFCFIMKSGNMLQGIVRFSSDGERWAVDSTWLRNPTEEDVATALSMFSDKGLDVDEVSVHATHAESGAVSANHLTHGKQPQ